MKNKEIKYALVIDTSKCFDCKACMIACKVENNVPEGYWRNWIKDNCKNFKRNNLQRYDTAINHYEADLVFLKREFYDSFYRFTWPKTAHQPISHT